MISVKPLSVQDSEKEYRILFYRWLRRQKRMKFFKPLHFLLLIFFTLYAIYISWTNGLFLSDTFLAKLILLFVLALDIFFFYDFFTRNRRLFCSFLQQKKFLEDTGTNIQEIKFQKNVLELNVKLFHHSEQLSLSYDSFPSSLVCSEGIVISFSKRCPYLLLIVPRSAFSGNTEFEDAVSFLKHN